MIISHKFKFIFIKTAKVGGTSIELYLSDICCKNDVFPPFGEVEEDHQSRNFKGLFNPFPEIYNRLQYFKHFENKGIKQTLKDVWQLKKYFEPMPAWQVRARVSKDIWHEYFKFTIERNPWDKAVSRYYHSKAVYEPKYKNKLTIDSWLDYVEHMLRNPWLNPAWGSVAPYNFPRYTHPVTEDLMVDKICRYEKRNTDLAEVLGRLGIPFNGDIKYNAKSGYRSDRRPYQEILNEKQRYRIEKIFRKEINLMEYSWEGK